MNNFSPVIPLLLVFSLAANFALVLGRRRLQAALRDLRVHQSEALRQLEAAQSELQHTIQDMSRQKAAAQALNQELRAANRYKDEFMATMSHELRTPLNSIIGYSDLLFSQTYGPLTEKQKDRLQRISKNAHHLSSLINAVLDLSKLAMGQADLDAVPLHWERIVRQVIQDYQAIADDKGLRLEVDFEEGLPQVIGDPGRLQQVVANLMSNACKFTHQGYIRLSLRTLHVQDGQAAQFSLPVRGWLRDGCWVLFSIEDSGIGIAPEHHTYIFDHFSQVDSSASREYEGIGMGLALVKRLVEMHYGNIWVSSQLGQGTTFFVALPTASLGVGAGAS
ncbi:MAG: HAMP domain-containing histidine kinase [Anaerolineae bacterium]|nr:HAMP domain-containing histidine kinase [Anaerolineae bacterium]MDW8172810.1 HAMP domain-containing sensor histidine kinase [Anaerolineae bacterium]